MKEAVFDHPAALIQRSLRRLQQSCPPSRISYFILGLQSSQKIRKCWCIALIPNPSFYPPFAMLEPRTCSVDLRHCSGKGGWKCCMTVTVYHPTSCAAGRAANIRAATNWRRTSSKSCVTPKTAAFSFRLSNCTSRNIPMPFDQAPPLYLSGYALSKKDSRLVLHYKCSQDPIPTTPPQPHMPYLFHITISILHSLATPSPLPSIFRPPTPIGLCRISSSKSSPRRGQSRCLLNNRTSFRCLAPDTNFGPMRPQRG